MSTIHEELRDLFSEDLLFSDNDVAKNRIKAKQQSLQKWGVDIIPEGLHHIRFLLQDINANSKSDIGETLKEFDWQSGEDIYWYKLRKGELTDADRKDHDSKMFRLDTPTISRMSIWLHSWLSLLGPVIDDLGYSANKVITSCLWLNDYQMATMAGLLLNYEKFKHFRDLRNLRSRLEIVRQTSLRLQLCQVLFSSGSPDELRAEIVPHIIPNKDLLELNLSNRERRGNIWLFIDDLIVWDIATNGQGPRKRWSNWWT